MRTLGERIKQARMLKNYTLRSLAGKTGVTHQAVSKYERGLDIPSSQVLLRLSKALDVTMEYFFREDAVEVKDVSFRKHRSKLSQKDQNIIIAKVKDCSERYLELENIVAISSSKFYWPKNIDRSVSSMDKIEEQAADLRNEWRLGFDPIENVVNLLEDNGIKVIIIEAHKDFDALAYSANGNPVIVVKKGILGDRQRFNLCHELGHLFLQTTESIDAEKAAHRFAGAFLVPKDTVLAELGHNRRYIDPKELYLLKHKYGLSMQAWVFRAHDLTIISETTFKKLLGLFRKNNWHIKEPDQQIPAEEPKRRQQLVWKALAEDIISESRAAELMGKTLFQFREERRSEGIQTGGG